VQVTYSVKLDLWVNLSILQRNLKIKKRVGGKASGSSKNHPWMENWFSSYKNHLDHTIKVTS
jgi:hypothetical protein